MYTFIIGVVLVAFTLISGFSFEAPACAQRMASANVFGICIGSR